MDFGPQGRLYVSRGSRIDVVNTHGRTTCCYPLEGDGWATIEASADGRHLYVGNFFTGRLLKIDLECGEEVARADTGVQRSLAGIAEYTGIARRKAAGKKRVRATSSRARPQRRKQRRSRRASGTS